MKKQRQQALIEFIQSTPVNTQEEIQAMLEHKGFKVTQATVSRDIKDLGIIKAVDSNNIYRYIYNQPKTQSNMNSKFVDIFVNSVINIESAMNDVVIKCHSGMASGACAAIDGMFTDDVVGTLAGDDTIFVITRSEEKAKHLVEKLYNLINNN